MNDEEAVEKSRRAFDVQRPKRPAGIGPLRLDAEGRVVAIAKSIIMVLVVAALSAACGLAIVKVNPVVVVGAALSGVFVLTILRWPYFGLMVYLAIFALRIGELVPALAPLRLEFLVGTLTLGSLLLAQVARHGSLRIDTSKQTRFMFYVVGAALLSMPLAYWRGGAWIGVQDFIRILVFYIIIAYIVDTRKKLFGFVWLYAVSICFIAFLSAKSYIAGQILYAQGIDRAVGVTSAGGGPNELGATMATTIPLFFLMASRRQLGWKRYLFLIGLALLLFVMITTGSRSAMIGFMASIGYLVWCSKHRILFALVAGILLVGVFAAMPEQYKGRYSTITSSSLDGSSNARIKVWTKGLHMIADRPLTGVGINCFDVANASHYSAGGRRSYLESHSLYIQVFAEMGFVGAFAFFGFIWVSMLTNRRTARALAEDDDDWEMEQALLRAILVGTIVLLFTGIFGHSLMRRTWYVYAALNLATLRIYLAHADHLTEAARRALLGNPVPESKTSLPDQEPNAGTSR